MCIEGKQMAMFGSDFVINDNGCNEKVDLKYSGTSCYLSET